MVIINKMQKKRKAFRDWDKGLVGRDQALEFLEGREPRVSNFLGFYCNITISLYFDISIYHAQKGRFLCKILCIRIKNCSYFSQEDTCLSFTMQVVSLTQSIKPFFNFSFFLADHT